MKANLFLTVLVLMMGMLATAALAQDEGDTEDPVDVERGKGHGVCQFVDEDGDGFNDLAPDHDGDGIPNGLDEDWVKPEDGTGLQYKWGENDDELFGHFGETQGIGEQHTHMWGEGDGSGETGPNSGEGGFGPGTDTGSGGNGEGGDGGDGGDGGNGGSGGNGGGK